MSEVKYEERIKFLETRVEGIGIQIEAIIHELFLLTKSKCNHQWVNKPLVNPANHVIYASKSIECQTCGEQSVLSDAADQRPMTNKQRSNDE